MSDESMRSGCAPVAPIPRGRSMEPVTRISPVLVSGALRVVLRDDRQDQRVGRGRRGRLPDVARGDRLVLVVELGRGGPVPGRRGEGAAFAASAVLAIGAGRCRDGGWSATGASAVGAEGRAEGGERRRLLSVTGRSPGLAGARRGGSGRRCQRGEGPRDFSLARLRQRSATRRVGGRQILARSVSAAIASSSDVRIGGERDREHGLAERAGWFAWAFASCAWSIARSSRRVRVRSPGSLAPRGPAGCRIAMGWVDRFGLASRSDAWRKRSNALPDGDEHARLCERDWPEWPGRSSCWTARVRSHRAPEPRRSVVGGDARRRRRALGGFGLAASRGDAVVVISGIWPAGVELGVPARRERSNSLACRRVCACGWPVGGCSGHDVMPRSDTDGVWRCTERHRRAPGTRPGIPCSPGSGNRSTRSPGPEPPTSLRLAPAIQKYSGRVPGDSQRRSARASHSSSTSFQLRICAIASAPVMKKSSASGRCSCRSRSVSIV